jgi:hypothetical protein
MHMLKATGLHRKSGGAKWRDLRFSCHLLGDSCSAATVPGSTALSFVISTGGA